MVFLFGRKKNIETFLVLGLDKFEGQVQSSSYNNDQQADFLMLFVFDNDKKEYSAIVIMEICNPLMASIWLIPAER